MCARTANTAAGPLGNIGGSGGTVFGRFYWFLGAQARKPLFFMAANSTVEVGAGPEVMHIHRSGPVFGLARPCSRLPARPRQAENRPGQVYMCILRPRSWVTFGSCEELARLAAAAEAALSEEVAAAAEAVAADEAAHLVAASHVLLAEKEARGEIEETVRNVSLVQ